VVDRLVGDRADEEEQHIDHVQRLVHVQVVLGAEHDHREPAPLQVLLQPE